MNRFTRKALVAMLLTWALIGVSSTAVDAKTPSSKPSRTSLTVISAKVRSWKVNVTVIFKRASTHSKSPLVSTQVKVGARTCTSKGRSTQCTVKGLASKTYKVLVRASNKNGWGPWSKPVSFLATSGRIWRSEKQTPGGPSVSTTVPGWSTTTSPIIPTDTTTLPTPRKDLSKASVLALSTVKLSKVGAFSQSGASSAKVRAAAIGDVVFKTSGVVAYAQAETASQTGSKLLAVSSTGSVSDALANGSATVRDFFTAPNGGVYVVFETKAPLSTGGTPCLLASIDSATGATTCIDSTLDSVNWGLGWNSGAGNLPIQTDAEGSLYYTGSAGSAVVLRKFKNNTVSDLINDNISLRDFNVLSDGTVLVVGTTNSSQVQWLRRISPSGSLKNLSIGSVQSLWKLADGKVYAGLWGGDYGVKRYSTESDSLEEKYWISGNLNGGSRDAHFKLDGDGAISGCTGANYIPNNAFCSWYGTIVNPVFNILGQKSFGVAGSSGQDRQLWQYYPTVERANVSAIKSTTLAQQVISTILLAGTSSDGSNVLSLYDTSSKQETVVMDGSNEVEIYSMSYSQRKNAILFSGLRFSDNKFVVGEVSLG